MKVLVTGGSGFIGSNLSTYLLDQGFEVCWLGRTEPIDSRIRFISIKADWSEKVTEYCPSVIVHLAASFNNRNIKDLLECNLYFGIRLLEVASMIKKCRFVNIGSYWQFGNDTNESIPIDLYSASKSAFESFLEFYSKHIGLDVVIMYMYGTYGSYDSRGKIVELLIDSAKHAQPLELTKCEQKLNLVHIDDVSKAIKIVISSKFEKSTGRINRLSIYSEMTYSLIEIVRMVEELSPIRTHFCVGAKKYRTIELFDPVYKYPKPHGWCEENDLKEYVSERLRCDDKKNHEEIRYTHTDI